MDGQCASVLPGGSYDRCRDGFPMTGPCWGLGGGLPICCNEKVCGRLYPETGEPWREAERASASGGTVE